MKKIEKIKLFTLTSDTSTDSSVGSGSTGSGSTKPPVPR